MVSEVGAAMLVMVIMATLAGGILIGMCLQAARHQRADETEIERWLDACTRADMHVGEE